MPSNGDTVAKRTMDAPSGDPTDDKLSSSTMETFVNKVICGDSAEILKQIPTNSINMIITSPPYYNQRDYGVSLGSEASVEEYLESLMRVFSECARIIRDDGSIFFNVGDKYVDGSLLLVPYLFAHLAQKRTKLKLINQITWVKPNPEPRQFNRRLVSSTEPIFHFVKCNKYRYYRDRFLTDKENGGKTKAGPNIGREYFRKISDSDLSDNEKDMAIKELKDVIEEVQDGKIWSFRMKIRGVHSLAYGGYEGGRKDHLRKKGFTIIRMYDRTMKRDVIESPILQLKYVKHPAVYPEKIVKECLNLTTEPGDVVLDPFLGSGTTAVVAKRMGRKYIGIELNKEYCEIARERLNKTLIEPTLSQF